MSYAEHLRTMLEPLGVYQLRDSYNGGELDSQGLALDGVDGSLEELLREADLTAAEDWGLELIAGLFLRRPVADSSARMRKALAALLRIGGDSFTLEAINDTIAGCGITARVDETGEPGKVQVSFPEIPGVPEGFEEISRIIEDILPAHLLIEYVYWYITWAELERKFATWQALEDRGLTWAQLETLVE